MTGGPKQDRAQQTSRVVTGVRATNRVAALALALAVIVALAISSVASANYYGIEEATGTNFHGTGASIRSSQMNVPNIANDFVNNDVWDVDSGSNYWVEAGLIRGTFCCNITATNPSFFWADQRPGGGFHSHLGPQAALNQQYSDFIRYQGSGTWTIVVGDYTGTSTGNINGAQLIQTGTETTTRSATACASQQGLQWWDANGGLHNGWSPSITQDKPPYAYWVQSGNWLRNYENASC